MANTPIYEPGDYVLLSDISDADQLNEVHDRLVDRGVKPAIARPYANVNGIGIWKYITVDSEGRLARCRSVAGSGRRIFLHELDLRCPCDECNARHEIVTGEDHGDPAGSWTAKPMPGPILPISNPGDFHVRLPDVSGAKLGRKDDIEKPRFDLIPPHALDAMARVLTSGAARYGENNWQQLENLEQRYRAAAMRHLNALARGEITDPDTGEHHAAHVMCCAAFLVEHHNGG